MKLTASIIAASLLVSGCAIIPEEVAVNYVPEAGLDRSPVLIANPVQLDVSDKRRAESPAWIADKKNGYGMRLASVMAQKPVVDIVRDAVAQELTGRGIRVGAGGPVVAIEVSRLDSVYQIRFLSIGAIGSADFAVQVRRPDGSIAYARTFSVSNDDEGSLAGTAGQARRSVEGALDKIVGHVVSDPAFIAALSLVPRMS